MSIYINNGLSPDLNKIKETLKAPKNTKSYEAIKKIQWFSDNETIKVHFKKAKEERVAIAKELPEIIIQDIKLAKKTDNKESLKKLTELFINTKKIYHLFEHYDPITVFKSKEGWNNLIKKQIKQKLHADFNKRSNSNEKEKFKAVIESAIQHYIGDEKAQRMLSKLAQNMIELLPKNKEMEKIAIQENISLFGEFLSGLIGNNIPIEKLNEEAFVDLFTTVADIRRPAIRKKFERQLIMALTDNLDLVSEWMAHRKGKKSDGLVLEVAILAKNNPRLATELYDVVTIKGNDSLNHALMDFLVILNDSEISLNTKESLLENLLVCHKEDKKMNLDHLLNEQKKIKGEILNLKGKVNKIKKDLTPLNKISDEILNDNQKDQIKKLTEDMHILKGELEEKEKELKNTQAQITKIKSEKGQKKETKNFHFEQGIKNLTAILFTHDEEMISTSLEFLKFSHCLASDSKVIDNLYNAVFDGLEGDISKATNRLHAPEALLILHSRMKELKGEKRRLSLENSKRLMNSVIEGTYHEDKHSIENNPHLQMIFENHPELKEKWMDIGKTYKVRDLIPHTNTSADDFTVSITSDPTDVLVAGMDLGHCLHLRGRINRVHGLLAFLLDGKIQTIVCKNNEGKIVGQVELFLLWDNENKKPIIFQDRIEYKRVSDKNGDETIIYDSIMKYCRLRAKELGLDVVSLYGVTNIHEKDLGPIYPGRVVSMGGPADTEYVNYYYKNKKKGVYELPKVRFLHGSKTIPHFPKTVVHTSQRGEGTIDIQKRDAVFEKLQKESPLDIFFNPQELKNKLEGGACSALSFDFASSLIQLVNQEGIELNSEEVFDFIETVGRQFRRGGGPNQEIYRSIQSAFNTIEVNPKPETKDISKQKVQALANNYNLKIVETTEDFVPEEGMKRLSEIYHNLGEGFYIVRMIKPEVNRKMEDFGHSMVLVKNSFGSYFFDPNSKILFSPHSKAPKKVFKLLKALEKKWELKNTRFHKIEPKESEFRPEIIARAL